MARPKKYTLPQKEDVLARVDSGESATSVSNDTGIPVNTIHNWTKTDGRRDIEQERNAQRQLSVSEKFGAKSLVPPPTRGELPPSRSDAELRRYVAKLEAKVAKQSLVIAALMDSSL